jgi:hypothetical protein
VAQQPFATGCRPHGKWGCTAQPRLTLDVVPAKRAKHPHVIRNFAIPQDYTSLLLHKLGFYS